MAIGDDDQEKEAIGSKKDSEVYYLSQGSIGENVFMIHFVHFISCFNTLQSHASLVQIEYSTMVFFFLLFTRIYNQELKLFCLRGEYLKFITSSVFRS